MPRIAKRILFAFLMGNLTGCLLYISIQLLIYNYNTTKDMPIFDNKQVPEVIENQTASKGSIKYDNIKVNMQNFDQKSWENFVSSFRAHSKKHQVWCQNVLYQNASKKQYGSQFDQDWFLISNFFRQKIMNSERGFYVDSGANDAEKISNTLFLDRCLGWKGLCVEPNPIYHKKIRNERSCTLVPECISNSYGVKNFEMLGAGSKIGVSGTPVTCRSLSDMLIRAGVRKNNIDLWSLDIEGFEMNALTSIEWHKLSFNVILIEDFWISNRNLDHFLTQKGYTKVAQLPIDSVWLPLKHTNFSHLPSSGIQFPKNHLRDWQIALDYRKTVKERLAFN